MVKKIIAKEDFLWYKTGQEIAEKDYNPGWIHLVTITDSSFNKELDLNNDGKIDGKDASIASKMLNSIKKSKK